MFVIDLYKCVLYSYSRPGQEEIVVEERELGPDGDLVASLISTVVIPIICKIIDLFPGRRSRQFTHGSV